MIGKIWERYFLKETLKVFFLILLSFYGLYILIDYTSRASSEHQFLSHFQWTEAVHYYFLQIVEILDVLIPFALMIATIRTLTQLNIQNELIALLASGTKMKTLLRPFILLGFAGTLLIYINSQFLIPTALKEMRHIHDIHTLAKKKKKRKVFVQSIALKDHSTLLFQEYDTAADQFFDAYWIKSFNEIYRMKYLSPTSKSARFVDHFARNTSGKMEKLESYTQLTLPSLRFNRKVLLDTITPPEELSLTKLWEKMPPTGKPASEKQAQLIATFYQKLVMPWLCLLAVLAPVPFCVSFSRLFPVFFTYAFSIFGLAACYIVLDASMVLASRQVFSASWTILGPFSVFMGVAVYRYMRLN